MDIIAERALTYRMPDGPEQTLVVQIGRPLEEDGVWRCSYVFGAPYSVAAAAFGEDSTQALVLALAGIAAHLNGKALRGRVTWLGMEDLGFPAAPVIAVHHP